MIKYLVLVILMVACSQKPNITQSEVHILKDSIQSDSLQVIKDSLAVDSLVLKNQVSDSLDATAQLIGGTYNGPYYSTITQSESYQTFSTNFSKRWKNFDSVRISKLISFSDSSLSKDVFPQPVLFYPFSGPDILYANTFFPSVEKFILIGLEPVGTLPAFDEFEADSLSIYYDKLNRSLNAILKFSFFRTESMRKDLKNTEVDGTIHLLFLFLSRTGNTIVSTKAVTIDSLGHKVYLSSLNVLKTNKLKNKGVEIQFKATNNKIKTLEYYSSNISNEGLVNDSGFANYLENMHDYNTYLKGASYLLHKTHFSKLRNIILNGSSTVIQDDSGIALRYFTKSKFSWNYKLYGDYTKPVSLFRNLYQKDLDTLYKKIGSTPLGFGIGYNFKDKNSNLMVARKS